MSTAERKLLPRTLMKSWRNYDVTELTDDDVLTCGSDWCKRTSGLGRQRRTCRVPIAIRGTSATAAATARPWSVDVVQRRQLQTATANYPTCRGRPTAAAAARRVGRSRWPAVRRTAGAAVCRTERLLFDLDWGEPVARWTRWRLRRRRIPTGSRSASQVVMVAVGGCELPVLIRRRAAVAAGRRCLADKALVYERWRCRTAFVVVARRWWTTAVRRHATSGSVIWRRRVDVTSCRWAEEMLSGSGSSSGRSLLLMLMMWCIATSCHAVGVERCDATAVTACSPWRHATRRLVRGRSLQLCPVCGTSCPAAATAARENHRWWAKARAGTRATGREKIVRWGAGSDARLWPAKWHHRCRRTHRTEHRERRLERLALPTKTAWSAPKRPFFEHELRRRINRPVVSLTRTTKTFGQLDETLVQRQVVSDRVFPAVIGAAEKRKLLLEKRVNVAECAALNRRRLDCHYDQRDVWVRRFLVLSRRTWCRRWRWR